MSYLYRLPLIGSGSEDIEALPSYLFRLAAAHGVSLNQLMQHIADCTLGTISHPPPTIQRTKPAFLVRSNSTTAWLIETLAKFGSEQLDTLRSATLLPLSNALSRSMREFSDVPRWCPTCIDEQVRSGQPAYFKLVWFFNDVKACRHHRLALQQTCPSCRHSQDSCGRWPSLSLCVHCQESISLLKRRDRVFLDSQSMAPDLVLLVANLAATPSTVLPAHSASKLLEKALDETANTQAEIDLYRALPYDDFLRYASTSKPMTLRTARRLAHHLGISIYDLLSGGDATNRSFGFVLQPKPQGLVRKSHEPKPSMRNRLAKEIDHWCEQAPASLAYIAKEMGVSTGALHYHFPRQAAELVARWKQHAHHERRQRQDTATLEIKAEIADWEQRHDHPMTRKRLFLAIRQRTGLPKHLLLATVAKLYPSMPLREKRTVTRTRKVRVVLRHGEVIVRLRT